MSPYHLVFGKACHFPMEIEHREYWAIKKLNVDLYKAGENRLMKLNDLDEFRNEAYENVKIYKEKTKVEVVSGKLKSRCSGPFAVVTIFLYGVVEVHSEKTGHFKVNEQRLKHYIDGHVDQVKSAIILPI
ncbi:uncharacterized protein LOC133833093 [Humulus lupulus]|uniref:uncharacterized protein LOC133833093 n=1 Tax=Humulus lupulus TaxID=3486 RepID=UPI002B411BF3|nr:uncharacterized protein LOC133833093 [Humulus lupulus]